GTGAERADLLRVGLFADIRVAHRRYRNVAELRVGIVDDLVRGLGAAGRAADEVAGAHLAGLVAVAQEARALHDEEHLFLAAMAVERAGALAGRNHVVGIAEVLRAQQRADAHRVAAELVALLEMLELELVDVADAGV